MRQSAKKTMLLVLAVLGIVVALPGSASAHTIGPGYGVVWQDGQGSCVEQRSRLEHGAANGGTSFVRIAPLGVQNSPWGQSYCAQILNLPAGYQAIDHVLWVWTNNQWAVCQDSGWIYSAKGSKEYVDERWEHSRYFGYPCGYAYYATSAGTYMWLNNAWQGGWMSASGSTYHWLPQV